MKRMYQAMELVLVISLALSGCDRTESDWKQAVASNTVPAYTDFLTRHAQGPHVDEAKTAIENLDWASATMANTTEGYSGYIASLPRQPVTYL